MVLLCWFLGAIAWRSISHGLWQARVLRALLLIYILVIADGLIQISWNQREIMALFGIVCGLLIAHTPSTRPAAARWNNAPWFTGTILLALALAAFETRHLAARSNKQIAIDAAYAGDAATADKYYQRASRWAPRDPEPIVARTHMALERGNLSASRSLVEKALQAEPDSAATHALAASIYQQLRQPGKADTHLTEALRLYPAHAGYNYLYAQHLLSQGQLSSALEFARKAERLNYLPEEQDKYSALVQQIQAAQEGKNPE
jgi:Tfp pilus assembly protein PilF